jgi:hypothetical protein
MQKFLFLTLLFPALVSFSQGTFVPLGSDAYTIVERMDIKYSRVLPVTHTADKSYYRGQVGKFAETLLLSNLRFNKVQQYQLQWLVNDNGEWLDSLQSKTRKPLWKFYREPASFAHVSAKKKGLFDLRFNPMVEVKVGGESYDKRFIFSRAVGLEIRGNIKRVFSFYLNVTGNSARPAHYITNPIRNRKYKDIANAEDYLYVPGQSYWKDYSSKIFKFDDGIDYFDARGYVNVNVLKYINVSIGRDKFFIGNGQRSFMLSDFSAPYLFLKMDIAFWRFKYQSILAELNGQYVRGTDALLPKKYMAVHHLSIQAAHFLNIGLFEGVIANRSNHFELQYLNPIIFYRAVEHAIGSPDNVLLGADFKANIINHLQLYGQFVLDEFNFKNMTKRNGWWANKWALQMGLKYIDIAPNLDAQLEVNVARPFIFTHESGTNYTHYNQPLAHPLGANFYEVILQARYQPIPQLAMQFKYIAMVVGGDTLKDGALTNYGFDVLRNSGGGTSVTQEYNNKIAQGARGTINFINLTMTYQPWHNIYIDMEASYRSKSSKGVQDATSRALLNNESSFVFIVGARMNFGLRRHEF